MEASIAPCHEIKNKNGVDNKLSRDDSGRRIIVSGAGGSTARAKAGKGYRDRPQFTDG